MSSTIAEVTMSSIVSCTRAANDICCQRAVNLFLVEKACDGLTKKKFRNCDYISYIYIFTTIFGYDDNRIFCDHSDVGHAAIP